MSCMAVVAAAIDLPLPMRSAIVLLKTAALQNNGSIQMYIVVIILRSHKMS